MTKTTVPDPSTGRPTPSPARQVWNFTRHFLEMCIAMCVGGVALNALVFVVGPAQLGYPDLRRTAPACGCTPGTSATGDRTVAVRRPDGASVGVNRSAPRSPVLRGRYDANSNR
jgi:hypothetical protein